MSVDLAHDLDNYDREKVFAMCPDIYEVNGVKKLAHHLDDKHNYVVHHRILKKYLREGMIVKKVNRIVFYREKGWVRDYIMFCVEQRKKADLIGNSFLKEFFKLMCNAVFGKSMENVRNRVNLKIINDKIQLQKEINKLTFEGCVVYHPDLLVGVHLTKGTILLNKPIYTGQTIFDDSKLMIYEFLYDYCFVKWGVDNVRVCITDTDSLLLEIKTDDLYKDFALDVPRRFDTEKYVRTKFGDTEIQKMNLKVLGMMKDELQGDFITEFVGIGPKNYGMEFIKTQEDRSQKIDHATRCKGIGENFTPNFKEYNKCILGEKGNIVSKECFRINSKEHKLYTIMTNKVALRNEVMKRLPDSDEKFETLPFGKWR